MIFIRSTSEASSEDDQISELNLTDNDEYYLIEFKLKYSDYTTQSDSLLTYQCKVPKKQIKGLTTGYTKLEKFTRPKIFLKKQSSEVNGIACKTATLGEGKAACNAATLYKLYISFNYELASKAEQLATQSQQSSKTNQQNIESIDCIDSVNTWRFKTMGIDIGVAKSATAAIITTNMHWVASDGEAGEQQREASKPSAGESSAVASGEQQSIPADIKLVPAIDITKPVAISNELTISDKTNAVSEHIEILKNEQNHIYKKEKAIYDLLKLKQFDGNVNELVNHAGVAAKQDNSEASSTPLFHKYQRLNKHRLHLRSKVSNLKKELSCLRSNCKRHDITCY